MFDTGGKLLDLMKPWAIKNDAKNGKYFILTKEEASGQLNMFNAHDELPNDDDPLPGEEETEEDDGE